MTIKLLSELSMDSTSPILQHHNYKECDIFLIQMGNVDKMNTMQSCSMESAALHHQNLTVCLAIYVRGCMTCYKLDL